MACPLARAQMTSRTVEIDGLASYYSFMSRGGFDEDSSVNLENLQDGLMLGGRFGIHFTDWVAFESTVGVSSTMTDDTLRKAIYTNAHFDAVFHLPFPYVVPYFAFGVGFQAYNIIEEYAKGVGPADFDLYYRDPYPDTSRLDLSHFITYRSSDGDFLVDAGGGAKFLIAEKMDAIKGGMVFGLRLDIRWKLSIGPDTPDDGVPTLEVTTGSDGGTTARSWNGTFNHIELGGGVFFLFGGGVGPDRDGDGIPNRKDQCPDDPEDKDDFEDEDGCPDRDNDKDGVPDERDACINEPEDRDDFQDEDGCIDLDNDQDGFPDTEDRCAMDAEDKDGFDDFDGCPDLDNDQDGFLDVDDKCPTAAETFNSYLDRDGCPDQIPGDLLAFAGAIPDIQFRVGSAQLLRSAKPTLEKAAKVLKRYPDLHVEIGGHASSEGSSEANMVLSQDRTMTVRDFLIARGVDPGRLTARGYGETVPVANNATEAGRKQNRRVEFKLEELSGR